MTDDPGAHAALFEEAYDELRRLAGGALSRLAPGATFQPTALVHEAWLKLGDAAGTTRGKQHFLALAALAMRQILVDAARRRAAARRGGGASRLTLSAVLPEADGEGLRPALDILDLHAALEVLGTVAPRPARLVELRFFGGLTSAEAADVLGVGETTVLMDWRFAKAWLAERLRPEDDDG